MSDKPKNWPMQSFDAVDWANAFCEQFPQMDNGTMLAWFAGALMRGWDEREWRRQSEIVQANA